MHEEAFLFVGTMVAFDITVEIRTLWRQDIGLDPHAIQELTQSRGKIACGSAAYPARITIEGQPLWASIVAQESHDGLESCFRVKVFVDKGV
jgi:hypothetical protein